MFVLFYQLEKPIFRMLEVFRMGSRVSISDAGLMLMFRRISEVAEVCVYHGKVKEKRAFPYIGVPRTHDM